MKENEEKKVAQESQAKLHRRAFPLMIRSLLAGCSFPRASGFATPKLVTFLVAPLGLNVTAPSAPPIPLDACQLLFLGPFVLL